MFNQQKEASLAAWRELATHTQDDPDPEQRYDELLKAADALEEKGLITPAEWRQLVREANLCIHNKEKTHG